MCWRDTQILVEKLNRVLDVSEETGFTQFVPEQKRVVATVESTFKIEKYDTRTTVGGTTLPQLITEASFNDKLKNVYFTLSTRLEANL